MIFRVDTDAAVVEIEEDGETRTVAFSDPEAFDLVSQVWLRVGWDLKYVYRFSWLGRPVIQLPEDLVRLQELVFALKPDVIVETGVAHGGSLVFFASLCELTGHGKVVGVDVEIRQHNRKAIEEHPLFPRITLVEGSSTEEGTFARVREAVGDPQRAFVMLDSNHSKQHVLDELRLYGPLVPVGSYVFVADGIMRDLAGAPRTSPDWAWDNPLSAVDEFLAERSDFERVDPQPSFDEGMVRTNVTYSPRGLLRRVA